MQNQYVNDFTRTTQVYYDELKKYKPLSKSKEKRLLKKCKKGSLEAKNELLEANLRFVFDIAKHYTGRGVPMSDLISEGNIGLIKAVDKFDESNNVKFISYAVWWIRQAMQESINKRKSVTFVEISPNNEDISENSDKLLKDENDDVVYNSECSYSIESEDIKKETTQAQKEAVAKLLVSLSDRERDIIENYYGINDKKELTLSDIGNKYNLTSERVRQIKKQALKKLRSKILLLDGFEDLF